MAHSKDHRGFLCDFIDLVPADFYCRKCYLVARKLTITGCCGESYCHTCIAGTQQQDKACPTCGQQNFTTFQHVKYQQGIKGLQVYCSMKERGCDWSGTLEQLDCHLDPDQDNSCQHMDIKCPLNCDQAIPRSRVEQHMAKECAQREHACQYCFFKATYQVVVDTHMPECDLFPLQCPNLCGVTCERHVMEDHMSMCLLEEVGCEFSGVGCDERLRRGEQEEHSRQNSQKHLSLTAAASLKMNLQLQQMLQEQRQEYEQKLQELKHLQEEKLHELEKKQDKQDKKTDQDLQENKLKLNKRKRKIEEQEQTFYGKVQKLEELVLEQDKRVIEMQEISSLNEEVIEKRVKGVLDCPLMRIFVMENYTRLEMKISSIEWKSPAMYTHMFGYKFYIGITVHCTCNKRVNLSLHVIKGEYDHLLKWPASITVEMELLNQKGGDDRGTSVHRSCSKKPDEQHLSESFLSNNGIIQRSEAKDYLRNDALYFYISNIYVV